MGVVSWNVVIVFDGGGFVMIFVFFFSSRRRHTRFDCDWSSDVCSSDLFSRSCARPLVAGEHEGHPRRLMAERRISRSVECGDDGTRVATAKRGDLSLEPCEPVCVRGCVPLVRAWAGQCPILVSRPPGIVERVGRGDEVKSGHPLMPGDGGIEWRKRGGGLAGPGHLRPEADQ